MNTTKRDRHSVKVLKAVAQLAGHESLCVTCGQRVVSRANAFGYTVWLHRKVGR